MSGNGRLVPVGDVELYVEERGTGRPLVLLHGFGGCTENWAPFVGDLEGRYRLVLVDLRGHGHSTNPANVFTHRQAAQDVFLLLDALGIDRFSAMGLSTGGMILLHMATTQPHRVESMVLVSATSHFPDQARTIMRRISVATMPPEVRQMYQECAKRGEGQIRELVAQFQAFHRDHDDMNFTAERLSAITARTLVVHGDRDNFFPVEIPVGLYRGIRRSELWVIPGGGHVPVYDPSVPFVSAALAFLGKA